MASLVKRLIPKPEICSSNPVIGTLNIVLKRKIKIRGLEWPPFSKMATSKRTHFSGTFSGRRGQLGHGVRETWRSSPTCVETLKTKTINRVGAGHGFSVFASDNGIVMTCGDGTFGNFNYILGNLIIILGNVYL